MAERSGEKEEEDSLGLLWGVGVRVPQSLEDYSGADVVGTIYAAHSWLPWEEAVGRHIVSQYKLFNTQSYPLMDRLPQVIVSSLSPEVHKQKAGML